MTERYDVAVKGCSPSPLAHYLKALGVLRIIAEDRYDGDTDARGYWKDEVFHIVSRFDTESLKIYFLNFYKPTPILSPWNGRGGFLEGEDDEESSRAGAKMIRAIKSNESPRFFKYKDAINIISNNKIVGKLNSVRTSRKNLESKKKDLEKKMKKKHGLNEKASQDLETIEVELGIKIKEEKILKSSLLQSLRSTVPEYTLSWMDACLVLAGSLDDNVPMSPLLGTGGVDGSQDFSVNFMQNLSLVLSDEGNPREHSETWLTSALFSVPTNSLKKETVGQFFPSAVGGPNATSGFEASSLMNPWDYILMIEGTLLFATASVKRLANNGDIKGSFSFTVDATSIGYSSASKADETSRRSAEIWVPLWDKPTKLIEIKSVMSEGRAQIGVRAVQNGLDFVRAVASLGVDRGINSFQRYGFLERNGRAYFAVSLDRIAVHRQPQIDLLSDVDSWLTLFTTKAKSDKAPASIGRAMRVLETSIFSLCKERDARRVQDVLISLGICERTIAKCIKWAKEFLEPIPALSERWIREADDGSPEFRLAASLASVYGHYSDHGKPIVMPIRSQMEPVHSWLNEGHLCVDFDDDQSREVIWSDGNPLNVMNRVMSRRIMRAVQSSSSSFPDKGWVNSDIGDITDFIEGRINVHRMMDLLWGMILIDWPSVSKDAITRRSVSDLIYPGASYSMLKLCFAGEAVRGVDIPIVPEIQRRATLGDSFNSIRLAERRLRGSGLPTAVKSISISPILMERTASALIFPIGKSQVDFLADNVLRPDHETSENK